METTHSTTTRTKRLHEAPVGAGFPIIGYYLIALLAIATLIIFYNVFAVANFGDVIRSTIEANLTEQSEEVRDDLRRDFAEHTEHLRMFQRWWQAKLGATDPGQDLAALQPEFANAAETILGGHPAPVSVFLAATPGERAPEDFAGQAVAFLSAEKQTPASGSGAGMADPGGNWTTNFQPDALFWDGSFAELATAAVRSGSVRNSALYLAGDTPAPTLTLVMPLMSMKETVNGADGWVLGVSFNITESFAPLASLRIGDTGSVLVVDENRGTVLSSPSRLAGPRHSILREHAPFGYNLFRDPRHRGGWQRVLNRPIGGAEVIGDDDAWYLAVASSVPELDWSVITYLRTSEITGQIRDRSLPLALLGLALFVTIVLAIFLLNRSLAYPLQRLLRAATRPLPVVTEENIAAMRTVEEGPREFATLAVSYNRLLDTISTAVHSKNEYAKKLESSHQRLKGFNRLLEKVVSDRTRELKEAKEGADRARENAERAQVAAEKANEAKSNFLANISHELRTPLNAIIGYTELLMEEAEDRGAHEETEDLKKVHSAGRHLLSLIDDILDIAKIEAGRIKLNLEIFSIASMLNEVIEATHPLARQNNNKLLFHSTVPREAEMHADRTKVKQILLNLTSNACKFTEDGTVTIEASIKQQDGKHPLLVCSVLDTGIGMSREQIALVFEKFSQADETATRKHGGTGLGLFICRIFSEMMGGDIQINSELGGGSRFTFIVPLEGGEVTEAQLAQLRDALPSMP